MEDCGEELTINEASTQVAGLQREIVLDLIVWRRPDVLGHSQGRQSECGEDGLPHSERDRQLSAEKNNE